jgi:hypothetical protein
MVVEAMTSSFLLNISNLGEMDCLYQTERKCKTEDYPQEEWYRHRPCMSTEV